VQFAKQLVKFGGDPKLAAAELKKIECASFAPGTRVWANAARLPIEALRAGTRVASHSDETYTDAPQAITRTFGRISPEYYRLTTEFETLDVTPEHPFYVQGEGWTQVKDIEEGQALATLTGDTLVVGNARIDQPLRVHNFSVATTPSYFIGTSGVWVHNASSVVCGLKPANPDAVVNALKNFETRRYVFGNETFQLDKSGMKHILERHHPDYWDGSLKEGQTFFDPNMSVDQVADTITLVLEQNRDILSAKGTNSVYQVTGNVKGNTYVVGVKRGRIGQFYPKD